MDREGGLDLGVVDGGVNIIEAYFPNSEKLIFNKRYRFDGISRLGKNNHLSCKLDHLILSDHSPHPGRKGKIGTCKLTFDLHPDAMTHRNLCMTLFLPSIYLHIDKHTHESENTNTHGT